MRRLALLLGFVVAFVGSTATDASAQTASQLLRNGLRNSIADRMRERAATQRQRSLAPPGARLPDRNVLGETSVSALVARSGCSDTMQVELRWKDEIDYSRQISDFADPVQYVDQVNALIPYGMHCRARTLMLTVVSPDGRTVARDRLTMDASTWRSDGERRQLETAASSELNPALFAPERLADLRNEWQVRSRLAHARHDECMRPINNPPPQRPGPRPSAEEQIRQSINTTMALEACNNQRTVDSPDSAIVRGVRSWAATTPATYDGLRGLVAVERTYRDGLADRERALLIPVVVARRQEIEAQLRPQIVADLNSGRADMRLVSELFGANAEMMERYQMLSFDPAYTRRIPARRDGSPAFFRRADQGPMSRREVVQAVAYRSWSEPTDDEIGLAILRSLRSAGGREVSASAVTIPSMANRLGVDMLDGLASAVMQIHDVQKESCVRAQAGFVCTYVLYGRGVMGGMGASHPIVQGLTQLANGPYGVRARYLLTPTADGWRIPEMDRMILSGQVAQMNQMTEVVDDVANAASNAAGVLTSTQDSGAPQSQMETERQQRVRDAEERARRRPK